MQPSGHTNVDGPRVGARRWSPLSGPDRRAVGWAPRRAAAPGDRGQGSPPPGPGTTGPPDVVRRHPCGVNPPSPLSTAPGASPSHPQGGICRGPSACENGAAFHGGCSPWKAFARRGPPAAGCSTTGGRRPLPTPVTSPGRVPRPYPTGPASMQAPDDGSRRGVINHPWGWGGRSWPGVPSERGRSTSGGSAAASAAPFPREGAASPCPRPGVPPRGVVGSVAEA